MDFSQLNLNLTTFAGYEALIAIALGVFLCLFGYKLKRVAFVIIWFAIGYYLMSLVAPKMTSDPTWQQILPIAAGVVLGVLGFSLEKLSIFAVAAYAVSTTLIDTFLITDPLYIALAIAAGVIVGVIAVQDSCLDSQKIGKSITILSKSSNKELDSARILRAHKATT